MSAPRRNRADKELVRRGLARSREQAVELIQAGLVSTTGAVVIAKPATAVSLDAPLVVHERATDAYVGRGAHKLQGALDAFASQGLHATDKQCLDAGACTGGFTQVLLLAGASQVIAADVGYGQLAWSLQTDPRVIVMDRANVRLLEPDDLPYRPQLVVADLSFISLRTVLPALHRCASAEADFVLMVKPQFEVGKDNVPKGGVVRQVKLREQAVTDVAQAAWELGLGTAGVVASPLPGASGNVEYFLWLRAGAPAPSQEAVRRAVAQGPQ